MIQEVKKIREDILRISHISGHGHIPTCFSVVELLYAVYDTMKHDPQKPNWKERDIFLLSKGHASLSHYCVLANFGYFDIQDVETFGAFGTNFGCHADRLKVPGVEASTGSLGHGIGIATGMALGLKIMKSNRRVFVLIGDGEANEGTVWESVMVASNLKLNNLTVIYDDNRSHARGLQITNPTEKFVAFGCDTVEVNGHDVESIKAELDGKGDRVKVVVAKTIKGCGCDTLVCNQYEWHRKSPSSEELDILLKELS